MGEAWSAADHGVTESDTTEQQKVLSFKENSVSKSVTPVKSPL